MIIEIDMLMLNKLGVVALKIRRLRLLRLQLLVCSVAISGCGIISGSGPYQYSITPEAAKADEFSYDVIDLNASTISEFSRPAPPPQNSSIGQMELFDVKLVAGDALRILIADNAREGASFAPLTVGGTVFDNVRSDSSGTISLPFLGRIVIAGRTVLQVESAIRKALRARQELGGLSDVRVELAGDWSGSVLVAGAVRQPGRFSSVQGPLTVLDVINRAGGPSLESYQVSVTVRNGTNTSSFTYLSLLAGNNFALSPRSEVIVESVIKRFVAMGALGQPGLHDFPSVNPSLLEAIGKAGGLNDRAANPSGIFVFRMKDDGVSLRPQVFRLDMRNPASIFLARQFVMVSEDAVYVTNAPVYEWQKIISPIVQAMFLGRTI